MRRDGLPICCEIWPGNMADVKTLVPVINALKQRFRIRKVVVVCDRGMVSSANLEVLERAGYEYIVGMKLRGLAEVRDEVLGRAGRYREVSDNLQVKEVWVEGERRYIVCFNPDKAKKDRHDREATLEKIRTKLASGGVKGLIGNRGYKRYLKVTKGAAVVDAQRVKAEERYDGKYVLRTTTTLPAAECGEAYKELTWIERLWRELKDVVQFRPVYHWRVRTTCAATSSSASWRSISQRSSDRSWPLPSSRSCGTRSSAISGRCACGECEPRWRALPDAHAAGWPRRQDLRRRRDQSAAARTAGIDGKP